MPKGRDDLFRGGRCSEHGSAAAFSFLLAEAERLHKRTIALDVAALQIVEQGAALTHKFYQRAFGRMIFTVGSHVLRQMGNTVGKQSHLALNGTSVRVRLSVLSKDLFLLLRI